MSEQLVALLNRYADDMSDGAVTPPAPIPPAARPIRAAWVRRLALPALAAASVVAVAVTATVLRSSPPAPLVAVTAAGQPAPVQKGDTPPPQHVLGPAFPGTEPVIAPAGREHLAVSLELPAAPLIEQLTNYTVTLANPSDQAVSLQPCPDYLFESGGQGFSARLPCERLPGSLAPGQTLQVELSAQFGMWDGPDAPSSRDIDVAWGIAGPPAARGRVALTYPPLGSPIATAPFVDAPAPPGEPVGGVDGLTHGMKPEWRLTPTIISAPTTVKAGGTLHYTVRLFNVDPKDAVPLEPCSGFTQWLQRPVQPAGEQVAFLDWSFERHEITSLHSDEHALNCQALPAEIPSRHWVQLEMELKVPADYAPGDASLAWKVGELDVFGSMQSRYVTVTVVP